ncbi:MAG: efflux RND transporter periplasmic adaptor subunit [Archangium sp.]|nr:efflux RND transporter periplasmic adaptor subunit [Archangium sp.]
MTPAQPAPSTPGLAVRNTTLPALIERERARRRRLFTWLAIGLVALGGLGAVLAFTRPRPVPMAARFRTAPLTTGDVIREVRATGALEAVSTVSVGAEISGRIATVEVDFNQRVTAGQVLARFDVAALEAQRAQSAAVALGARAQLEQAKSDFEQAQRTKTRSDTLFAQKVQTDAEHEAAVTALSIARARVAASEATLAAQTALATVARTNLEHAIIRAPIDGVIITRNIDPGQTVASMFATPVLFTVAADLRKMEVLASVDEADIAQVTPGQTATFTVTAFPNRVFEGSVTEVRNAARIVQDVVTYGVVVSVDNLDLALRPGMTASVKIRTGFTGQTTRVPNAALRFTPPGQPKSADTRVWWLDGDTLQSRTVQPGLTDGEDTALADPGLPANVALLVDLSPEGKKAYGLR